MEEEWRDIKGYEGLYQVSDLGRVRSLDRVVLRKDGFKQTFKGRLLKPSKGKRGYLYLNVNKHGKLKTYRVHQLVAMAFLDHVPCGMEIQVDHIKGLITDNRVENLQILTKAEHNEKTHKNASSKYKGVSWSKKKKKWKLTIWINGKQKHLGYFKTEIEAHEYYQAALIQVKNGTPENIKVKGVPPSSKYKGVYWNKALQKWVAQITIKGKGKYLGLFNTEIEAHKAAQKADKLRKQSFP